MKHLFPRVKRRLWRRDDSRAEAADADFRSQRLRILKRDNYRCVYCGFRCDEQEVNHINDDHTDNRDANLETADTLCHSLFSLGQVGSARAGRMVYVPELSREDFNHLQRTVAIVMEIGSEAEKAEARQVFEELRRRVKSVEQACGTSNPLYFGEAMLRLPLGDGAPLHRPNAHRRSSALPESRASLAEPHVLRDPVGVPGRLRTQTPVRTGLHHRDAEAQSR